MLTYLVTGCLFPFDYFMMIERQVINLMSFYYAFSSDEYWVYFRWSYCLWCCGNAYSRRYVFNFANGSRQEAFSDTLNVH